MKYRITIVIFMICLVLFGFVFQPKPLAASGNTYYVAKTGNDSNNGSFSSPWLTINYAAQKALPGDYINIEGGTYNERVVPAKSGTAGNPITYQNYNGETVVIDGTSLSFYGGLFQVSNLNYITVSGLTIQNSGYAGIFDVGISDHIILQNLVIHDTAESGILVGSYYGGSPPASPTLTNMVINNCTIYNTNSAHDQEGVSIIDANGVVVDDCNLSATEYDGAPCIDCKLGCENVLIHNNIVHNSLSSGIYVDASGQATSNISIYDNLVYNNAGPGIQLADEHGVSTLSDIDIYNNILYDNSGAFEVDHYGTEVINFNFINNTLYCNYTIEGTEILIAESHVNLSGCVIRNNIIDIATKGWNGITYSDYANGGITVDHNLFYSSGGSFGPSNIWGTTYVQANPLLTNPTTDFSLQSGSPAIDVGSSTGAPSTDFIGTSRPQGAGYDMGAYEYQIISPLVLTNATTTITDNEAIISGNLTTLGTAGTVTVSFDWGTDTNYTGGNVTADPTLITSVPTTFSATLTGLTPGLTYHYRAKAIGTITAYGNDQQFTTLSSSAPLGITTNSLSAGTIGVPYLQTLTATGGTAPYTWSISSGSLPVGLSFSSNGIVSGNPTPADSTNYITFQVTDSIGSIITKTLSLTVQYATGDVNMDGSINIQDIILVNQDLGETGTPGWIREDVNSDGIINVLDIVLIGQHLN